MIGRLLTIITAVKEFAYRHTALRLALYLGIVLALILFWITAGHEEISFVYNNF